MTTHDIVIRDATFPRDAVAVAEVCVASATHHAELDPTSYRIPDIDALVRHYRRVRPGTSASVILVAEQDGRVVGAAEVRLLTAPQAASMLRPVPTAGVELAVLQHNRGALVRELLTKAAEDWAGSHGARRIQLDVLALNRHALESYRKRHGFEIAGVVLTKELAPRRRR